MSFGIFFAILIAGAMATFSAADAEQTDVKVEAMRSPESGNLASLQGLQAAIETEI